MIEDGPPQPRRKARRGDIPIATIAELAGVSPPTVSKVINGRPGVGRRTRERVEALLRDHGYRRPPPGAATRVLEVVFEWMLGSIAIEVLRGVEEVASAHGCTVGFTDVRRHVLSGESWMAPLIARKPTGVITVSAVVDAEHSEELAASGIPMVALDPLGRLFDTPTVGSSNWSGALAATRHLLALGHRRLGLLTGPVKDLASRARRDGFRAAIDHAGVPFDESLERQGVFTFESGRDLAAELLALPDRPTAILCGDDLQAMGAYEAARRAGLRIPDDLSVVGFDDIDQAGRLAPGLTTVRQPFAEMGATAAGLALALAGGQTLAKNRYELDTHLVIRESTASPPRL